MTKRLPAFVLSVFLFLIALLALAPCAHAAGFVVGTHRATGSYSCQTGPFFRTTFAVSTYLYLANTGAHSWGMYLTADLDHGASGVTVDVRDSSLLESSDNGAVVYNDAQDTLYVHKLVAFQALEYTHDELIQPYSIQVTAVSTAHPYGQLVIAMYPQGHSDPSKGECIEPVTATLEIQP